MTAPFWYRSDDTHDVVSMPPSPPIPLVRLALAPPGQLVETFARLVGKQRQTTREGRPFWLCQFRDLNRVVQSTIWSDSRFFSECETDWQLQQDFRLRGVYLLDERYGAKWDLVAIRLVIPADSDEGYRPQELVAMSREDPAQLWHDCFALAETIQLLPLRRIVQKLLTVHQVCLQQLPATDRKFFPFPGGWLEHTRNVARHVLWLTEQYQALYPEVRPPLNRDVLLAAALLHELGRVREWEDVVPGTTPEPTLEGRIYGHVYLAIEMIREAASLEPELPRDARLLLEHLVLSHLVLPEWGSPRLPLVPEALILHHADDLDAKMEMYLRCLTQDQSDGLFTARDPILNKPLWKGRSL